MKTFSLPALSSQLSTCWWFILLSALSSQLSTPLPAQPSSSSNTTPLLVHKTTGVILAPVSAATFKTANSIGTGGGSYTFTLPLLDTSGTVSIATANGSTTGALTGADWSTFNAKAPLASPTFTGVPAAPTAAADTNTTQIATTAFVIGQTYLKTATAASTYQPLNSNLTSFATVSPSANALSLLGAANYAAMRALLDLEAGTDFLGYPTGTPTGSKFLRDDNSWQTIPGGGDALTSSPLSQFAATTSAQLRGVLTDENGTGAFLTDNGSGASLTALNATQLTSGTVPDARFPATLPAASGVNLTALNGTNIASGTVAEARIDAAITRDAELDTVAERTALGIKSTTAGSPEVIQDHGNMGATETFDLATANVHRGVLDTNLTLTLSGFTNGLYCSMGIAVTQDATGSRTITWPAAVATAPVINPAAQSITFLSAWSWDGGTVIYVASDYVPDSGVTAATYGSATAAPQITVNAKGLVTAAANVTVTPAVGSITGLGTGVATALAVNVGSAGSPVVNGGALGTPSSGNGSNLTALNATELTSGTIPIARVADGAVTYAKLQDISATSRVLGRITAGAGDAEELTGANVRTIAGLATSDSPELAGVNVGDAADTTITRTSAGNLAVEGNAIFRAGGSFVGLPGHEIIAISDETTAITTGTAKVTWRAPFALTITAVRASLATVSSSGTPTFDINEAGTTILSTKLTIDASEKTSTTAATAAVISDSAIADDAEITIDVDTAGTGATGAKITIYYVRA